MPTVNLFWGKQFKPGPCVFFLQWNNKGFHKYDNLEHIYLITRPLPQWLAPALESVTM